MSHFFLSNLAFQKRKVNAERSKRCTHRSIMHKNQFLKLGASRPIQVEQQDHSCHSAEGFLTSTSSVQVSLWSKPCHALSGREFFSRRLLTTSKRISIAKVAINKKKTLSTRKFELNFRVQVVKRYIWSIALYGAETSARRKINHKSLGSFELWRSRRMKIILTDRVKNEVLQKAKGERNILHTMRWREANWIGHKWSSKFLLNHRIEGNLARTGRQGKRRKLILDRLKGNRRCWNSKEEH